MLLRMRNRCQHRKIILQRLHESKLTNLSDILISMELSSLSNKQQRTTGTGTGNPLLFCSSFAETQHTETRVCTTVLKWTRSNVETPPELLLILARKQLSKQPQEKSYTSQTYHHQLPCKAMRIARIRP